MSYTDWNLIASGIYGRYTMQNAARALLRAEANGVITIQGITREDLETIAYELDGIEQEIYDDTMTNGIW